MHRDLDFGSRIGNDKQNREGDFSCGSHNFWQDTYQGISQLGQRDRGAGCAQDRGENKLSIDLSGHENLYGSFAGRSNHDQDHHQLHGRHRRHENKPETQVGNTPETQVEHKLEENTKIESGRESTEHASQGETKDPVAEIREMLQQILAMLQKMEGTGGGAMSESAGAAIESMLGEILAQLNSSQTPAVASSESHADNHLGSGPETHAESGSETQTGGPESRAESHSDSSDQVAESGSDRAPQGDMAQVLFQNDWGRRGIVQADIPFHGGEGWGDGKYGYPPTADVTNYSPWGVVSQQVGKDADENASINVKDQHVYFHLKGGGWVEAASPANTGYWEAEYRRDFAGNQSWGNGAGNAADGSYQFRAPSEGRVDHFGSGNTPLKFDPAKYDGIFQSIDAKADRDNSGLVINFGGDYQRDYGITQNEAGQTEANLRNPPAGANNWTTLTSDYQRLYFTTMTDEAFKNDPPPGIA